MYFDDRKTVYYLLGDSPELHTWKYYEDYELDIAIRNNTQVVHVLAKGREYMYDDDLINEALKERDRLIKEGAVKNYE